MHTITAIFFFFLRFISWIDWDLLNPRIERADLAGMNRVTLRRLYWNFYDTHYPTCLIIDLKPHRIYWLDEFDGFIRSIDFDGNNVESVHYVEEYISPLDCALYEHNMYWADLRSQSIQWLNKSHPLILQNYGHLSDGVLKGVVVAHESRQPYGKTLLLSSALQPNFQTITLLIRRWWAYLKCPVQMQFFPPSLLAKKQALQLLSLVRKAKFLYNFVIKHFNLWLPINERAVLRSSPIHELCTCLESIAV